MLEALESKKLLGVAFDTLLDQTSMEKLTKHSNVIFTPGIGDHTFEAIQRISKHVSNSIVDYIKEGDTVGAINFPNVKSWKLKSGVSRIINIHRNVPGVLKEINNILSLYSVKHQMLDTLGDYGYIIADISTDRVALEVVSQLALLSNSIRTRIL